MEIEVNKKLSFWVGLILITFIAILVYTSNQDVKEDMQEKTTSQIKAIEKINIEAKLRQNEAKIESDIAKKELEISQGNIIKLQNQLKEQSFTLARIETNYNKSLQQLNITKNENYIPTTTLNEQLFFLANYEFTKY